MGTLIYVDGKPLTVEGHRLRGDDHFVVTDDGEIPYLKAKDESGVNLYEAQSLPESAPKAGSKGEGQTTDKDTDVSDFPYFSRGTGKTQGVSRESLIKHTAQLMMSWKNRPQVEIVSHFSELPQAIQEEAMKASDGSDVEGVYWKGQIYLVAANIKSPAQAETVIFHEVLGHYGLRKMLGDKLIPLLNQVYLSYGQSGLRDIAKRYGLDLNTREGRLTAAEEQLAHMAQRNEKPGILKKLYAMIRDWLREMGFSLKLNDADIALALERAANFVREGREGKLTELEEVPLFQRVFHGTHARGIEKEGFKLNKIGTGEGAQAFGYGLYFASEREFADFYRRTVSGKQPLDIEEALEKAFPDRSFNKEEISSIRQSTVYPEDTARKIQNKKASLRDLDTQKLRGVIDALRKKGEGQLYHAEVPDDSDLLNWDKPLSEQPKKVREALKAARENPDFNLPPKANSEEGSVAYERIADALGSERAASEYLNSLGIPGLRYLDGATRSNGEESYNYVIWDDRTISDVTPYYSRKSPPEAFRPDPKEAEAYREKLKKTMASLKSNAPPIELGRTSPVLRALGAKDLPIAISRDVVRKATNGVKHNVPIAAIEQLPEELYDPLFVFKSRTHSDALVALTQYHDADGLPVVVALDLRPTDKSYEVNRIASVYGKDGRNPLAGWVKEGKLAYKSKRADTSPVLKGLQLPNSVSEKTSPKTILDESDIKSNPEEDEAIRFSRRPGDLFEDIQAQVARRPTVGEYVKHKIEDWRPGWLGALTRLHLADVAKGILPQAKRYVRQAQQMDADRNHLLSESAEIAQRWGKYQRKFKAESSKLADLMHDATIIGVDPAESFVSLVDIPAHQEEIRTLIQRLSEAENDRQRTRLEEKVKYLRGQIAQERERIWQYPLLKERYRQLSGEGKTIYSQVRDHYYQRYQQMYQALVARIDRAEVSGAEKSALKARLRARFESSQVAATYFPLARFGDYWVQVKDGDEAGFYMFESAQAQGRFSKEQQAKGHRVTVGKSLENIQAVHGASEGFLSEVMGIMDEAGLPQSSQVKDAIYQLYLTTLPELSARKHFIHRKKTQGYHQDALRAFAKQTFHGAYQLARLKHSDILERELENMRGHIPESSDPNKAADLYNEFLKRHE